MTYSSKIKAYSQRLRLATYKVATVKAKDFLKKINIKKLTDQNKPGAEDDRAAFYARLQQEAENGPIFLSDVLSKVESITKELNKDEVLWVANELKSGRQLNLQEFYGIVDWSRATNSALKDSSYAKAQADSKAWHAELANPTAVPQEQEQEQDTSGYETKDVIFEFPDGYTIVRVTTPHDLQVEGQRMGHCVGSYCDSVAAGASVVFSLRDRENLPHVTLDLNRSGQLVQAKGKQDKAPVVKYQKYILDWLITSRIAKSRWVDTIREAGWAILDDPEQATRLSDHEAKLPHQRLFDVTSDEDLEAIEDILTAPDTGVRTLVDLLERVKSPKLRKTIVERIFKFDDVDALLLLARREPSTTPEVVKRLVAVDSLYGILALANSQEDTVSKNYPTKEVEDYLVKQENTSGAYIYILYSAQNGLDIGFKRLEAYLVDKAETGDTVSKLVGLFEKFPEKADLPLLQKTIMEHGSDAQVVQLSRLPGADIEELIPKLTLEGAIASLNRDHSKNSPALNKKLLDHILNNKPNIMQLRSLLDLSGKGLDKQQIADTLIEKRVEEIGYLAKKHSDLLDYGALVDKAIETKNEDTAYQLASLVGTGKNSTRKQFLKLQDYMVDSFLEDPTDTLPLRTFVIAGYKDLDLDKIRRKLKKHEGPEIEEMLTALDAIVEALKTKKTGSSYLIDLLRGTD